MKYLLLLLLPLLPLEEGGSYKSKDAIVGVAPGVFYAEARSTSKQRKGVPVMFNMAHILTIESIDDEECVVAISQGSKPREYFVKVDFEDFVKEIKQTYHQN